MEQTETSKDVRPIVTPTLILPGAAGGTPAEFTPDVLAKLQELEDRFKAHEQAMRPTNTVDRCTAGPGRPARRSADSNTLAKWATAVSDTLALGLITEGIGLGLPIVALPHFNDAQSTHPAVTGHVQFLRDAGVSVLLGEGRFVPHKPRHGDLDAYPWQAGLDTLPS
ncbi:flavoprotein [Streptomyces sp. NPDC093514]|uniref:flavoprotein n=1 Tax=Streptomyces sp. NPDC093514 TaxID=3366039 RepID=UPI0037FD195E